MCAEDKENVSLVHVAPATWTGFNNFVDICADCQTSERYKKLVKQKKILGASSMARE